MADVLTPPPAFLDDCARARVVDRFAADNYIRHNRHTMIGDPELDPVMEELADLPPSELHRFIRAGVERDDETTLLGAPQVLRDFFDNVGEVPDWVEFESFKPDQRAFIRNLLHPCSLSLRPSSRSPVVRIDLPKVSASIRPTLMRRTANRQAGECERVATSAASVRRRPK